MNGNQHYDVYVLNWIDIEGGNGDLVNDYIQILQIFLQMPSIWSGITIWVS